MSLHTENIRYGEDEKYSGYVARPSRVQGPLPAILVLQEIWGVDEHIQNVTRRFAEAGFVAFAPDLYARDGKRKEAFTAARIERVKQFLETVPPTIWNQKEERDSAMDALPEPDRTNVKDTFGQLFGGINPGLHAEQLLATTEFLRISYAPSQGQPIASIGFCMGGALSGRLASQDSQLRAAAIFYGNAPDNEAISTISCPVMGFYGSLDARITDAVPAFEENMKAQDKTFTAHVYEGAHHAFFNDTRSSYSPSASRDAFARVLTFFVDQLSN